MTIYVSKRVVKSMVVITYCFRELLKDLKNKKAIMDSINIKEISFCCECSNAVLILGERYESVNAYVNK